MPTITKTLQYQEEDGDYRDFDQKNDTDIERMSILLEFDSGAYQVRIPGKWPQEEIENTIQSEIERYGESKTAVADQVLALIDIVS